MHHADLRVKQADGLIFLLGMQVQNREEKVCRHYTQDPYKYERNSLQTSLKEPCARLPLCQCSLTVFAAPAVCLFGVLLFLVSYKTSKCYLPFNEI